MHPPTSMRPCRRSGVTLLELLIALAILGTLAMIVIPAWQGYAARAHRTEALQAMGRMQTRQESIRNIENRYSDDLELLGFPGGCTENCVYLVSFDEAPGAASYTARFTPNPAGGTNGIDQTRDQGCSWFTIDAQGRRAAESARCLEGR